MEPTENTKPESKINTDAVRDAMREFMREARKIDPSAHYIISVQIHNDHDLKWQVSHHDMTTAVCTLSEETQSPQMAIKSVAKQLGNVEARVAKLRADAAKLISTAAAIEAKTSASA